MVSEIERLFPLLTLRKYYDNKMLSPLEAVDFYMMTTGSIFGPAGLKFIMPTKDWWVGFFCRVLRNCGVLKSSCHVRWDNRNYAKFLLTVQLQPRSRESSIYGNVDLWISENQWSFNFHGFRGACWKRAHVSFRKTFQAATSETLKFTVGAQKSSWHGQFISAGYVFWRLIPKVSQKH